MKQKHIDFCEEYLANGYNAKAAYRAIYKSKEARYAYVLLKRPEVKEYLDTRIKELYEEKQVRAETIATELAHVAFTKDLNETITCSNKLKALELLQKQLGLQTQKMEADIKQAVIFEGEDLLED